MLKNSPTVEVGQPGEIGCGDLVGRDLAQLRNRLSAKGLCKRDAASFRARQKCHPFGRSGWAHVATFAFGNRGMK